MDVILLTSLSSLSPSQKTSLRIGKVLSVSDLLLGAPTEIAKRCKITLGEAQNIISSVCKGHGCEPRCLADAGFAETFTTGDANLDTAIGGGWRTGLVWEVVGESAAGKTQFGLQLALAVQLPLDMGGLSGSACYLTTSAKLPTGRLTEMSQANPLLSSSDLLNVQTMSTNNIPLLLHVLSDLLPKLIKEHSRPPAKPVKLLVIDALAELFHSSDKTTTQTLVERSRNIYEISSLLHSLASKQRIAVLVLNEVSDAFERGHAPDTSADLVYSHQSHFFSRGDSIPGESNKEASLGLVWANQVNVRIMLSRTGRRRHLDDVRAVGQKLQKVDGRAFSSRPAGTEDVVTLVRRMSVIFSSVAPPISVDYIVTTEGISVLPDISASQEARPVLAPPPALQHTVFVSDSTSIPEVLSQVSPLDVGCAEDALDEGTETEGPADEWDVYWEQDDVPDDAYNIAEFDDIAGSMS